MFIYLLGYFIYSDQHSLYCAWLWTGLLYMLVLPTLDKAHRSIRDWFRLVIIAEDSKDRLQGCLPLGCRARPSRYPDRVVYVTPVDAIFGHGSRPCLPLPRSSKPALPAPRHRPPGVVRKPEWYSLPRVRANSATLTLRFPSLLVQ